MGLSSQVLGPFRWFLNLLRFNGFMPVSMGVREGDWVGSFKFAPAGSRMIEGEGLRLEVQGFDPASRLSPQTSISLTAGCESGGHGLCKCAEIVEVVAANVEHDLPVDVLVTMYGDITEPHRFGQARG